MHAVSKAQDKNQWQQLLSIKSLGAWQGLLRQRVSKLTELSEDLKDWSQTLEGRMRPSGGGPDSANVLEVVCVTVSSRTLNSSFCLVFSCS